VPDFAQGLIRDLRVRRAPEEAGIPFGTKLLGANNKDAPALPNSQPWGQVPAIEGPGLVLSMEIHEQRARRSPASKIGTVYFR